METAKRHRQGGALRDRYPTGVPRDARQMMGRGPLICALLIALPLSVGRVLLVHAQDPIPVNTSVSSDGVSLDASAGAPAGPGGSGGGGGSGSSTSSGQGGGSGGGGSDSGSGYFTIVLPSNTPPTRPNSTPPPVESGSPDSCAASRA